MARQINWFIEIIQFICIKRQNIIEAYKTFEFWLFNSAIGVNNRLIQKLCMIRPVLVKKLQHW